MTNIDSKNILEHLLEASIESEILEFKEAKKQFDQDKLGKYFSALSNEANLKSKPHAWMLFGVNDKCEVTGTEISDKQLNAYKLEISKNSSPSLCFIEANRVEHHGKSVIMLKIPASPKGIPIAWKGHYYGRDGESLGALNISEIEQIRNQVKEIDWSAKIIHSASIEDLSQEAISRARELFTDKNPKIADDINSWSTEVFLNKAKLTIDGKITNAAIILLGESESEHFIQPALSRITWVLKDKDNIEKDYKHFCCPFILEADNAWGKIRNLKYRYIVNDSLFPEEVEQYDPFIIRESLHNAIAHQDYELGGRITIVEREDGVIFFSNLGSFIPSSIENVLQSDSPSIIYRNPFLTNAMVGLNMIDTMGSGIKKMFILLKNRFFPMPDYDLSNNEVKVTIWGKVIDDSYSKKLAQMPELSLTEIMMLDKIAKQKQMSDEDIKYLRGKKLIEGRKPNLHISNKVADQSDQQGEYLKLKGFDDNYYMDLIIGYLKEFSKAKKKDIDLLLFNKLPEILSDNQKEVKVKYLLQKLKIQDIIVQGDKRYWILSDNYLRIIRQ